MKRLRAQTLFEGSPIRVSRIEARRRDGSEVERDVVEHPGSVAIVAHDEESVYLVRQPREAVDEDGLLEIPAGTLDVDGEGVIEGARRELAEEVGLRADHRRQLHVVYASPGFLDETVTIFEATGLSEGAGDQDEDERIEVVRIPLDQLDQAIADVRDAKTLIGLLLLKSEVA